MTYTYDLNTGGVLIIRADDAEREALRAMRDEHPEWNCYELEANALKSLICNSELQWITPDRIGALTDAPILGILKPDSDEVEAAWGFMDYAVRSFVDDLIDKGEAVFTS